MKILIAILSMCLSLVVSAQTFQRKPVPKLPPKPKVPFSETMQTRVDPHGAKNINPTVEQVKQSTECLVCHTVQNNKLSAKATAAESCSNCHNGAPHSGVQEHLKHKVTCTSCHTFHRGEAVEFAATKGVFKHLTTKKLESGLQQKSSESAMLRKNCTDCHNKW